MWNISFLCLNANQTLSPTVVKPVLQYSLFLYKINSKSIFQKKIDPYWYSQWTLAYCYSFIIKNVSVHLCNNNALQLSIYSYSNFQYFTLPLMWKDPLKSPLDTTQNVKCLKKISFLCVSLPFIVNTIDGLSNYQHTTEKSHDISSKF